MSAARMTMFTKMSAYATVQSSMVNTREKSVPPIKIVRREDPSSA
jgi:hypothetical protein